MHLILKPMFLYSWIVFIQIWIRSPLALYIFKWVVCREKQKPTEDNVTLHFLQLYSRNSNVAVLFGVCKQFHNVYTIYNDLQTYSYHFYISRKLRIFCFYNKHWSFNVRVCIHTCALTLTLYLYLVKQYKG